MTLKRIHSEAFFRKMKPVFIFRDFYTESLALISEGILEITGQSQKNFVLTRGFIDLKQKEYFMQPYVIFFQAAKDFVILDLVSRPATVEYIIDQHDQVSVGHSIFGVGSLLVKNNEVILDAGQNDDLVATILWSVDFKTNLEPDESGVKLIYEILNPSL